MGITWRVAMPLLSTLAALVIIVHSEEDMLDRDRRYDLRPRSLDTGTPSYDQPWRAIEADSVVNHSPPTDIWNDSPEEPPKRRRPVRKRKRRPLSEEDRPLAERKTFPVDPQYNEPDYPSHIDTSQTTDPPRKRRKKPEVRRNRWTDDLEPERPIRRHGPRRKRPSLDTWPLLSEFNEYRSDENQPEIVRTEQNDPLRIDEIRHSVNNEGKFSETWFMTEQEETNNNDFQPEEEASFFDTLLDSKDKNKMSMKEDKSLSEFSMEVLVPNQAEQEPDTGILSAKTKEKSPIINQKDRHLLSNLGFGTITGITHYMRDKLSLNEAVDTYNTLENVKAQEKLRKMSFYSPFLRPAKSLNKIRHKVLSQEDLVKRSDILMKEFYADKGIIDPLTLKEILKRSNGTSLSEILQQHNLSLSDLLNGREDAISALKTKEITPEDDKPMLTKNDKPMSTIDDTTESTLRKKYKGEDKIIAESKIEPVLAPIDTIDASNKIHNKTDKAESKELNPQETMEPKENSSKIAPRRRFPGALRRKLRVKPVANNNTFKANVNRDIIALTARKYLQHARNSTKSKEWKILINSSTPNYDGDKKYVTEPPITTTPSDETTTIDDSEYSNPSTIQLDIITDDKDTPDEIELSEITTTVLTTEAPTTIIVTTTEKVKPDRGSRLNVNRIGIRRQPLNRLKRRRMKQKTTTASPFEQEEGNHNIALSSELVTKTQTRLDPNTDDDFTTLEDFMTTERAKKTENGLKYKSYTTSHMPSTLAISTTEETAKFEIEEIFNDTRTSARLSRILMERNMTLNELVEHRERGSSHVHLADIFHNASKEPNPPEPFLSKSLIEPISKETYPLRALLEANLHDPSLKATTVDPNQYHGQFVNIPVAMDFGNNVNENGENMGIMSLFNKFAEKEASVAKSLLKKDSEGVPYVTTIESVNTAASDNVSDNARESKSMGENLQQDIMNWNDLFALMRKKSKNDTDENEISFAADSSDKKSALDQDRDSDGLIVLEDLQNFKDLDSHIASASNEKLEVNTYERVDVPPRDTGFHGSTKSVTVATASIVGLAMILFLLTYAVFKWRTQRRMLNKEKSFTEENIPTPVFESRKGHKNNCSTRSISPMLATSNIYTLNTLESRNGKESPEYMWDSLRKPFQ